MVDGHGQGTNGSDATVSWRDLLAETRRRLTSGSQEGDARTEARWLVEEASGAEPEDFDETLDTAATIRGVARLDAMVERRLLGEPIQYVLGHWAFRRLDLFIDRRVLIPRPETEIVVDHVLRHLDRQRSDGPAPGTVIDLGTGSGAIGLSVAMERPATRVLLTDADDDALAIARANLAGLGIVGGSVEISSGEWFDAVPDRYEGVCDVVVSNPPYVRTDADLPPSVVDWEPTGALFAGDDGLEDIRIVISGAGRWLRPEGALVIEMDPGQAESVREFGAASGFDVELHEDLAGHDRVAVLRRERSADE